jgi:hypothetical protein
MATNKLEWDGTNFDGPDVAYIEKGPYKIELNVFREKVRGEEYSFEVCFEVNDIGWGAQGTVAPRENARYLAEKFMRNVLGLLDAQKTAKKKRAQERRNAKAAAKVGVTHGNE